MKQTEIELRKFVTEKQIFKSSLLEQTQLSSAFNKLFLELVRLVESRD